MMGPSTPPRRPFRGLILAPLIGLIGCGGPSEEGTINLPARKGEAPADPTRKKAAASPAKRRATEADGAEGR